jgi:hypothetical protein
MIDASLLPFSLPSVDRKKITAAFDGGRISQDCRDRCRGDDRRHLCRAH